LGLRGVGDRQPFPDIITILAIPTQNMLFSEKLKYKEFILEISKKPTNKNKVFP
jgi:hypothetical protein